jgi:hypothetical protein
VTGVAREVAPFTMGVDCLSLPDEATAAAFYASGYRFFGLYLEVLTDAARDAVFNAGMGILPITLARTKEPLTPELGRQMGGDTVTRAMARHIPMSVHIVLDLESPMEGSDVIGDLNEAAGVIDRAAYQSMLYVGAPQPLTAVELYALKPDRYWRSISRVPEPACGWSCLQLTPGNQTIHGHLVDVDVIQQDYRGRVPVLWFPS